MMGSTVVLLTFAALLVGVALAQEKDVLAEVELVKEVLTNADMRALMAQFNPKQINKTLTEYQKSLSPQDAACLKDMEDVINGTKNFEMWALTVVDSWTKLQGGLLQANMIDLGHYDECVNVERPLFNGQHCLAGFILNMPGLADYKVNVNNAEVPLKEVIGGTYLKLTMGQCFPSTCRAAMISSLYDLFLTPLNTYIKPKNMTLYVKVNEIDCHVKERGPFTPSEWIVSAICVMFVLIAAISTTMDMLSIRYRTPTQLEKVLLVFSVYSNGKKLFNTEAKGDEMTSINGIKFLSIAWVVLGHRYRYLIQQPIVNILDIPKFLQQWSKMFVVNGTLAVDTFFLISGLLNAYVFFTVVEKTKKYRIVDVLISYVHRFVRLSPPYIMIIAITATWLYRVGDGPLWDRMVGDARDACATQWWWNLLYINNYMTPERNCLMQSWYLAADMQMFWLAPLALYPLWRWPLFGHIQMAVFTVASVVTPFAISYAYDIKVPIPITNDEQKVIKEMNVLYLPMHTKTVGYVVGLYVGYILYRVRTNKMKLKLKFAHVTLGWMVGGASMLYALFGCYWLFQTPIPYSQFEASLYLGFYRFFWAIGVGWLLVACVTGYGGFINTWLSWKLFWPLGRLTYCIYLTHVAILIIEMGSFRTSAYLNDFDNVEEYIGDLFFSVVAAAVLSLLVEAPTLGLEKIVLRKDSEYKVVKPQQNNTKPESLPLN